MHRPRRRSATVWTRRPVGSRITRSARFSGQVRCLRGDALGLRDRAAGHAGILRGEVSRAWRTLLRRLPGWLLGNLVQICTKRRRRLLLLTSWLSGRLRLKDLIRRLPRSNTYVLTADGVRFAVFCTKVANRLLEPLVAADAHPHRLSCAAPCEPGAPA